MEALHDRRLVVHQALPEASRLGCVCDGKVRLKAHLALRSKRVRDLCGGLARGGRESLISLEQYLEEELRVEREGRRVEGDALAV